MTQDAPQGAYPAEFATDAPPPADAGPPRVREIPGWLVALVIAVCVGGGAWFVYANWLRTGPSERIVILDRGPDDGITSRAGRHEVRSGNASLAFSKAGGDEVGFEFKFVRQDYLTAEEVDVLTKVWRLTRDAAMARQIGVTPQQMAQLRDNRARAKVELPDAEKPRLKELFLAWDAEQDPAAKRAAETKLIKAVDAVAVRLESAAKQSAADRAAEAKAILTAEQMQKFDAVGAPDPAAAAKTP